LRQDIGIDACRGLFIALIDLPGASECCRDILQLEPSLSPYGAKLLAERDVPGGNGLKRHGVSSSLLGGHAVVADLERDGLFLETGEREQILIVQCCKLFGFIEIAAERGGAAAQLKLTKAVVQLSFFNVQLL